MITIEIRKNKDGNLRLFAPAVAPGATVVFGSIGDPGYKYDVEFTDTSPFDGSDSFRFSAPSTRIVSTNAGCGIYYFHIREPGDPVGTAGTLQLTVESGGICKVGFSVEPGLEVHTLQWAPAGQLDISLDKSEGDDEAQLTITDSNGVHTVTLPAGRTGKRISRTLGELLSILSIRLDQIVFPDESGGTGVVDIIVDPPG